MNMKRYRKCIEETKKAIAIDNKAGKAYRL
jgi:hypothetical protein